MFIFDAMMRLGLGSSSLLGSVDVSWITDELIPFYDNNLGWILLFIGVGSMAYAIYLGVEMARSYSSDKTEAAKKRLYHFLIGVAIGIIILFFMRYLMDVIPGWFINDAGHTGE